MTKQKAKDLKFSENLSQTTVWQFKKVVETGNVGYLLKIDDYDELPEFDVTEISIAWYNIYAEFSEIVGGNRADLWLVKRKRLIKMQLDYRIGAVLLRAIQICPVQETIQAAAEFGYFVDINDLQPTFEKAYTKLMRLKNKISVIESEANRDQQEIKGESMEGLIASLEKFQGYQFDEHSMNMVRFANIYKNYKDAGKQAK